MIDTSGELVLNSDDKFVLELFTYENRLRIPPFTEHIREVFETRAQAYEYIRGMGRQIRVKDMTTQPPTEREVLN